MERKRIISETLTGDVYAAPTTMSFKNANVHGVCFSGMVFENYFLDSEFNNCSFRECVFTYGTVFKNITFSQCNFNGCRFENVLIEDSDFTQSSFFCCDWQGMTPDIPLQGKHNNFREIKHTMEGLRYIGENTYSCGKHTHTVQEYLHKQTDMEFVRVPGGSFMMGSPDSSAEAYEKSQHRVTLSSFLIGKYPVTQAQWEKIMGNNPSEFKGNNNPVEQASWDDSQEFCKKTGLQLPSEAQWEYACRAGSPDEYCFGDDVAMLKDYAWYYEKSDEKTHPVGQKKPNAYGLCDVHGNVWEWCEDDWHYGYENAPKDGGAWVDNPRGSVRVIRGGSWVNLARVCRSTYRAGWYDHPALRSRSVGLRCCSSSLPSRL